MSELYQAFRINQNRKLTTIDAELSAWQDIETVSPPESAFRPSREGWPAALAPEKIRETVLVPGIVY